MPTVTSTYAFSGGVDSVPGYGSRWQIGFGGTWAVGDTWTVLFGSTAEDLTIGVGSFANIDPTVCFMYRNRMYIGLSSRFLASAPGDVTGYEEQDVGATFIEWLSQYGVQDEITALTQLQGRLAVFGSLSIQLWTVDADPGNFNMVQTLDNVGTEAPLSVQTIGDYDAIFLDVTGFRSLRARETTLNAETDDIGIAIDALIQTDLLSVDPSTCCAIIEPEGKRYWGYLNGKIYVLSRFSSSKILAWSYFLPVDSAGVTFVPQKFVIHNKQVFLRSGGTSSNNNYLIAYGGSTNNVYDATVAILEIPWLDDGSPKMNKICQGIDIGASGGWTVTASMVPATPTMKTVWDGVLPQGTAEKDSTYDLKHLPFDQQGTHFKVRVASQASWLFAANLSTIVFHYNPGDR